MFRKMRRERQLLDEAEAREILCRGSSGVLAVAGDDGYPYAVPLSYVYRDGSIYFHCALDGHKTDAITKNDKVSFCVVDADQVVPEEYTTHYRSVIVFGRAHIIQDAAEKRRAIELLADKYAPLLQQDHAREIGQAWERFYMVELAVEHMTGKEAIELVRARQAETGDSV